MKERKKIPKPKSLIDAMAEAKFTPPLPQEPSSFRVTQLSPEGQPELAVIHKITYTFEHNKDCKLADEQIPLDIEGAFYDDVPQDVIPSYKSLPEVVGYKTGTDLIVQANANAPYSTREMMVSVQVGKYRHEALVTGKRYCEFVKGKLCFTEPESFEIMPLRYENAYGGRDKNLEEAYIQEVLKSTSPDVLRRAKPSIPPGLKDNNLFIYPRNRSGKGYVIEEGHEWIEGRELPNLERPDDCLTPENIALVNPFKWVKQPVPVGFDYLEPLAFPRCAMLGMPPYYEEKAEEVPEVKRALVPPDFNKGHILFTPDKKIPSLFHPSASRCASLGLWLPFLKGDEEIILNGMDQEFPQFRIFLPRERPVFKVKMLKKTEQLLPELYTFVIEKEKNSALLIWTGRLGLKRILSKNEENNFESNISVEMMRV